jgi:glycosyltransferase involved in cell wall biosynthesis
MRILYDGTPLLMRSAGVKNYHHSLLKHLIPNIAPHRLRLFPYLRTLARNRNDSSNYPRLATSLRLGAVLGSNYLGFSLADFDSSGADLFHATQHVWKLPQGKCLTSMVHDTTPLSFPECHTQSNIRYFQAFVGDTLHRLHRVLVPSHAVKTSLVEELRVPDTKISVVYHGVEEAFFESSASAHALVRQKYKLPDKYVLFVGTLEPRKNAVRLIEAYSLMPEELRWEYPLVLVGSLGWKSNEIKRALAKAPKVNVLGHVIRALLPQIYHGASLFAFPTLYEGFGLPLLEAMAARLPIITSNTGAAPEIAGDSALQVDPLSVAEISNAMERILGNVQLSSALGGAGRQKARAFTWQRTAAQTKAFFEKALGG